MKIQYLLFALLLLSFSVLLAQETQDKISSKSSKATNTTIAKQSIDNTFAIDKVNSITAIATYDFTVAGAAYTTGPDGPEIFCTHIYDPKNNEVQKIYTATEEQALVQHHRAIEQEKPDKKPPRAWLVMQEEDSGN